MSELRIPWRKITSKCQCNLPIRTIFLHPHVVEFEAVIILNGYMFGTAPVGNGPLTRYVKLQVAHAPGMPGTFPPPPISKETNSQRSRHASRHVRDARAVMHVGIAHLRWRGKRSRHSRRMRTRNFTYLARGPWTTDSKIQLPSCSAYNPLHLYQINALLGQKRTHLLYKSI